MAGVARQPPRVSPDDGYAKKKKASIFYDDLLDKNDRRDEKLYNLAELNQRLRMGQNEIFDRKKEVKAQKTKLKKLKKSISDKALLKQRLKIMNDPTKDGRQKVKLSKELEKRKKETEKQIKSLEKQIEREKKDVKEALNTYEIGRQALDDIGLVGATDPGTWQDQMTSKRYDQIKEAQERWKEDHPGNESIPVPEPVKEKPKSWDEQGQQNITNYSDKIQDTNIRSRKELNKTEQNLDKLPGEE